MSAADGPVRGHVLGVVLPVCAAGLGVVVGAAVLAAGREPRLSTLLGVSALLVVATVAERFPVPVGPDAGTISLHFVFTVATVLLFGWEAGVIVGASATALMQVFDRRPPMRVAYNASVFAIAALAAGLASAPLHGRDARPLIARTAVCGAVYYAVNLALITLAVSVSSGKGRRLLVRSALAGTTTPFGLMLSATLILVVLWERSPALAPALVGPTIALALYQRSNYRELQAMRLALTDPLTGLGNHRHFQERLQRELVAADAGRQPLTLCLVDVDDFKRINDRFGHPAGDALLSQVAGRLRQGGEAFRLGGDEFALLLPGLDDRAALTAAESVVDRIGALRVDDVGSVTVSAGVATFPLQGTGRDELIRLADSALYWAKEHGKNRVRLFRPDVVELTELSRLASGPDRAARFRAASSLARAVDTRDAYTGSHSERVSELAARIAAAMGLAREQVELTRLAASLHDLGKLAIPEEILRKPGALNAAERLVLERHPQIGFRMLESFGVEPVAAWVLHHHERWDGTGYPARLAGDAIPLGARIIFVADAYDAMTSDRVYGRRLSPEAALTEVARCSGTQFDPSVVSALAGEVGSAAVPALAS